MNKQTPKKSPAPRRALARFGIPLMLVPALPRFGPPGCNDLTPEDMALLAPDAICVSKRYHDELQAERLELQAQELRSGRSA